MTNANIQVLISSIIKPNKKPVIKSLFVQPRVIPVIIGQAKIPAKNIPKYFIFSLIILMLL